MDPALHWKVLFFFLLLVSSTNAQFGEIASLATSLLGGALGNGAGVGALAGAGAAGAGAAGQAGGALAQIGQLYQLAQGALQLTGTGVGVLNQASEGNWFPAVLEQTAKNSQALMKQGGGNGLNLGALGPSPAKAGGGLGPEFGTSFPAPNIDDYDENAEIPGVTEKKTPKAPDGLVDIEEEDYDLDTTTTTTTTTTEESTTTTEKTTEEEEAETTTTIPPPRQIRIQLPDKNGQTTPEEDLDYEDLIKKKSDKGSQVIPTIDAESTDEIKKNIVATHGAKTQPVVPKLDKLVQVLQKSKLSKEEIDEIIAQVDGNRNIEKPAKYDFNAAVQNIPERKNAIRQKITDASRIINSHFENQNKEQNVVIQKQVDEFKIIPDPSIQSRSVPDQPIPVTVPSPLVPTTVAAPHPAPQPFTNNFYQPPQNQFTHPFQHNLYPGQFYGQPTQNYWGLPHFNHQYGFNPYQQQQQQQQQQQLQVQQQQQLQTQQPHQQPYQQPQPQHTPQPQQTNQNVQPQPQPHQPQQPQQPHPYQNQQQQQHYQQYYTAPNNNQQGTQQQQYYHQQQQYQQPQQAQQQYQQPHQQPQQLPHYQQPQQPHQPQQPYQPQQPQQQQYRPDPTRAPLRQQGPQPVMRTARNLAPSQQVVYQQGSARPTPAVQKSQQPNVDQVVHYYNDGKQIVQQIIPKKIAVSGTLPLNGPFQSQRAASVDVSEYQRRQQALQKSYNQPQSREAHVNPRSPVHVQPKLYESTVTAVGHRQVHAIRTYQATKSVSVNEQPDGARRSSGKVNNSKRRYSGHVLPGPTIDHRSLLEKRTTAKPRYVRTP